MAIFFTILGVILVAAVIVGWTLKLNLTILASAAALAMLVPLPVYAISTAIAKNSDQTYNEYWNGFETAARLDAITCERDGNCSNTYQCDSYTVMELEYYTDSEGKQQSRMVSKTYWHSCPYSTQETSYYVDTTLGSYTIARSLMTGEQWRFGASIPNGQVTEAPVFWTEAKNRIDSGNPGPVAKVSTYKNYILSSQQTLFKRYSGEIETYREANLLPDPTAGITGYYDASKAYFVGVDADDVDVAEYSKDISALSAAFGTFLQGDLHVVFVDAEAAGNSTDYGNSLMAYWQSEELGDDALAKNTMVVVIGVGEYNAPTPVEAAPVDPAIPTPTEAAVEPVEETIEDGTAIVEWAKAYTGMPLGNEALTTQIESQLKGEVLDEGLIGRPSYDIATASMVPSEGVLENMLFGSNAFERVSMSALDEGDSGSGFEYLSDEWAPDAALMTLIYIISSVLVLIVLGFGAAMLYTGYKSSSYPDPLGNLINGKEKR